MRDIWGSIVAALFVLGLLWAIFPDDSPRQARTDACMELLTHGHVKRPEDCNK